MLTAQLKNAALIIFAILLFFPTKNYAQTGAFDIRFLIHSVDCANEKLYFDIQVRADEPGQEFYLGDQNYRFSFFRDVLANPQIEEELDISGYMPGDGQLGFTLYSPHNLTGSLDTIVSYNLELSGGDGYYTSATDYVSIGRISMDVLNFDAIMGLRFHKGRNGARDFPIVFIGQHYEGSFIPSDEGSYLDYFHDFTGICNNETPLTNDDFASTNANEAITVCLLDNDNDPENELNYSTLSLIGTPSASEGTVSLDANTGCLTFVPNEDFTGEVTPFEYEICNSDKYVPAYQGDLNTSPIPTPDPGNPDILVTPSTCATATVYISVGNDTTTDVEVTYNQTNFDLNVFPNPAEDVLNISYILSESAEVSIALWNVLGQPIKQLELKTLQTGTQNKSLDVSELSKGNYLVVLNINGRTATKMIQIK